MSRRWFLSMVAAASALSASALSVSGQVEFHVALERNTLDAPASGRVVVYLIDQDSPLRGREPADGPFFEDPQPMFSVAADGLVPGGSVVVDDDCVWFPVPPSELEPGVYRAQAVLDRRRRSSRWTREAGNVFSDPTLFEVTRSGKPVRVDLRLSRRVEEPELPRAPGVSYVRVRSELLSDFRGEDVYLRAGVVEPIGLDPDRRYAVVYQIPGFGGELTGAVDVARRFRAADPDSLPGQLARQVYWVVLDPEGPNGHHLFADSANNGPVGRALVEELVPVIDTSYQTIAEPGARLLRGHSSGGWSTIWLGITYPETFGAMWSSSPDPVDFRAFQAVDIYHDENMYRRTVDGKTVWIPSYSDDQGRPGMTIRQENRMEEVLGPNNTSAQQWDSWLAVFGPRSDRGTPADLYDPATGELNHAVAERFRRYDIGERLRGDRAGLGPILKQRLRLIVGEMDNYDLDDAVRLLKRELDSLQFGGSDGAGFIEIVPGVDHSTIYRTREMQAIPGQMLEHLVERGYIDRGGGG